MKTLLLIVVLAFAFTHPIAQASNKSSSVVIYGVVYVKMCNTEVPKYYRYKVVDASNQQAERLALKNQLENDYPTAMRIRMGSSNFDFGTSAGAMYIYSFGKSTNNCVYDVLMVQFGANENDAYERAVKNKNLWGGRNSSMSVKERITF